MVIQIRGTSGSGKSTLMKRIMEDYEWLPVYIPRRKKPLYYTAMDQRMALLGHYESPCGGCDTIGSARQVYELIQKVDTDYAPSVILCEGLLLSEDTKWSTQLADLHVLFLTTPLETCLERIGERRKAAGNDKELNPANTANRVAVFERARVKLEEAGVDCRVADAELGYRIIKKWIYQSVSH